MDSPSVQSGGGICLGSHLPRKDVRRPHTRETPSILGHMPSVAQRQLNIKFTRFGQTQKPLTAGSKRNHDR